MGRTSLARGAARRKAIIPHVEEVTSNVAHTAITGSPDSAATPDFAAPMYALDWEYL